MSTTDIIKQLSIFSKQNEGIISSLKSKNVELNYEVIFKNPEQPGLGVCPWFKG